MEEFLEWNLRKEEFFAALCDIRVTLESLLIYKNVNISPNFEPMPIRSS